MNHTSTVTGNSQINMDILQSDSQNVTVKAWIWQKPTFPVDLVVGEWNDSTRLCVREQHRMYRDKRVDALEQR